MSFCHASNVVSKSGSLHQVLEYGTAVSKMFVLRSLSPPLTWAFLIQGSCSIQMFFVLFTKFGVISKEKYVASSHAIAGEFCWPLTLIETPAIGPRL